MESRCREVFKDNGAVIELESNGLIFLAVRRGRKCEIIESQSVDVVKTIDDILAVAAVECTRRVTGNDFYCFSDIRSIGSIDIRKVISLERVGVICQ